MVQLYSQALFLCHSERSEESQDEGSVVENLHRHIHLQGLNHSPLPWRARVFREILRAAQDDRRLGLGTGSGGGSRIGGRVAVDVLGEALGKGRRDFLLEGLE